MKNTLINSTIAFYSPIPTTYFLPHQKTLIRTKVTLTQTFKAKRDIIQPSRKVVEPRLNCTCTSAPCHSNHNKHYYVHAMFSPVSLLPCFQLAKCTWAPFLLPNMVRNGHTTNTISDFIYKLGGPDNSGTRSHH